MTDEDWAVALEVFRACRLRRGDNGRDDRKFLEAMHYFTVHNISWRALPAEFGSWNSVWKRFWRLRQAGAFELFFETLASLSSTAHLVQMFDPPWCAPMSPPPAQKGAGAPGRRPLARRLLHQDPPQERLRRPANRLPPDRW
ncbi:transposase [Xanthobacter autotrophicus]|uniref:transposase n=1 Tax=Xanthobacter autotrophicus TaxID=280 RepID=UPI0024A68408|nr:transposase [Xanthobacter autotrophicus]MDI4657193.1 transposase [Xanthobacter autotrophicus]